MSIVALVLELLQLGLPIAEEIVAGVNQEMALSGRDTPPTEDEMRLLDQALAAAHTALQTARQGDAMANSPPTGSGV